MYYHFDNDNWSKSKMSCEKGELKAYVEKQDFSVMYYYISVEYRNGTRQTSSYVHEYRNAEGQKILQIMCIIAFFIFFIIFEVVMRYPVLKRRKSEEEGEGNEGGEKEKSDDKDENEVTIMKCPNCGKLIPSNSDTCPYCGITLNNESKEITMGDD